jgi:uncharacterized protein YbjT (DUF2867 family)
MGTMTARILVLGATGTVGGELVSALVRKGCAVRGATRSPQAARTRTGDAVEWVQFDLERPETFGPALSGVDRVFLIARPGDQHSDRVALPLIDAMKTRGVRHVVNLTAMGTEMREDFALRKIEVHLEASGLEFTHLRPNWFMQMLASGSVQAGIRATGSFGLPAADARISWIDARDISAVAAQALTTAGHAGRAYTLTGPAALDHHQIARMLSGVTGREVRYVPLDEDQARGAMGAAGFPPEWVERLITFYRLIRAGFCAPVSPDVAAVLGRPPAGFERFAAEHASAWM